MSKTPITFRDYPYFSEDFSESKSREWLTQISYLRKSDIETIQSLPQVFLMGRKVGRVPSSSTDVISGDRVNDFNWTATYLYILVDNAGTGEWRRVALGVF